MDNIYAHHIQEQLTQLGALLKASLVETAWPTRCALCDAPHTLLCESCFRKLPFVDYWRACPNCGAPFGLIQCCTCNPVMLPKGHDNLPFDGCVSAVHMTQQTGRLITLFKDQNERRLALVLATLMHRVIPPDWKKNLDGIIFIPASLSSLKKRDFDHMELLVQHLSIQLDLPIYPVFERPKTIDQRALSRTERFLNMKGNFSIRPDILIPKNPLLVDDVFTTGATLFSACETLQVAGVKHIRCLTFARV